MANEALIKGELGVHMGPTWKGELITKPVAAALQGFLQQDAARSAANAKRAGEIQKKAQAALDKGNVAGATDGIRFAGQGAMNSGVDAYRKSGDDKDLNAANTTINDVNHATESHLDNNTRFVEIVGDGDGEIDIDNMPNMSAGTSQKSLEHAMAIYGDDPDVFVTYNPKTRGYEFTMSNGEKIEQSSVNNNIFEKNYKFGTMMTDESTAQGSKDMAGKSRRVNYNDVLRSKGQIVSGFYDEAISGVPTVAEHLGNPDWANVDHKDFNLDKVKKATIEYYNQILDIDQQNFQTKKKEAEQNQIEWESTAGTAGERDATRKMNQSSAGHDALKTDIVGRYYKDSKFKGDANEFHGEFVEHYSTRLKKGYGLEYSDDGYYITQQVPDFSDPLNPTYTTKRSIIQKQLPPNRRSGAGVSLQFENIWRFMDQDMITLTSKNNIMAKPN